jgi:hypothetical protein
MRGALLLSRIGRRGRLVVAGSTVAVAVSLAGALSPWTAFFPVVLLVALLGAQFAFHRRLRAAGPLSEGDRAVLSAAWRTGALPVDVRQANALLKIAAIKPGDTSYWFLPCLFCLGLVSNVLVVGTDSGIRATAIGITDVLLWILASWTFWRRESRSRPLRAQARERWIRGYAPGVFAGRSVPPSGWPMPAPGADPWAPPRG